MTSDFWAFCAVSIYMFMGSIGIYLIYIYLDK